MKVSNAYISACRIDDDKRIVGYCVFSGAILLTHIIYKSCIHLNKKFNIKYFAKLFNSQRIQELYMICVNNIAPENTQ